MQPIHDMPSFYLFVQQQQSLWYRYVYRRVPAAADADRIINDTMAAVWEKKDNLLSAKEVRDFALDMLRMSCRRWLHRQLLIYGASPR